MKVYNRKYFQLSVFSLEVSAIVIVESVVEAPSLLLIRHGLTVARL